MKKILLAALLMSSTITIAQTGSHRRVATQPLIMTLVDDFIDDDPEDEYSNFLYQAWQKYKKHQPLDPGDEITVDPKNGYMQFVSHNPESDFTHIFEVCYWNCSDGKRILVAYNGKSFEGERLMLGQYDGLMFTYYNKATRKPVGYVGHEDLGIDMGYGIQDPERGYSSQRKSFWYQTTAGDTIYLREKEDWDQWLQWVENNTTSTAVTLPRQGRDITVSAYVGSRQTATTIWQWDGNKFHLSK